MTYISEILRREIASRASSRCEYCLYYEQHAYFRHEIDHIYAEKHGGATDADNLCLACYDCNRHKGSDLCSLDLETGEIVTLFHPRRDHWSEHFTFSEGLILGLTSRGRVTVRLLRFNADQRVSERIKLTDSDSF